MTGKNSWDEDGVITVRYSRLGDITDPAEMGRENVEVKVREWDTGEGVDIWLPDCDEPLSLGWTDARGVMAALALAELPRPRG
jgi:hypothetical protein